MTKQLSIFITIILLSLNIYATHNRAGEITFKQISDLTFEITITTYTYTLSAADREELEVEWGDNTFSIAPRTEKIQLPNYYQRNKYVVNHTYPGPGMFNILVQDPNRNYGVENIPNSVNTIFSISTTLMINPEIGQNSTPILLNPPINKAALYRTFIHNPGAFDYDGDSLSYELTPCTGLDGDPIPGYTLPPASDYIHINEITGDLVWKNPIDTGKYNIAILIKEWRYGVLIGEITRDMQIDVYESENIPPENEPMTDFCIMAGDTVSQYIYSYDEDLDSIKLSATGGPFLFDENKAEFNSISSKPGEAISQFYWETACNNIRKNRYYISISAEDNYPGVSLVDIDNFSVKVIAPAPDNLEAEASNSSINLSWDNSTCKPEKYIIYRREGTETIPTDSCTTGIPIESDYEYIGETQELYFTDNNNGDGLIQGINYCYRIVAEYSDGAQSYPSEEICQNVVQGFPKITNVDVLTTDLIDGNIQVKWAKPTQLDTIPGAEGPFKYLIYRSDGIWGMRLELIDSLSSLEDTSFIDTNLNTTEYAYSYEIELINDTPGNRFRVGIPQLASSIFLELEPSDNKILVNIIKTTPWLDNEYVIYRLNNNTSVFDSIGFSTQKTYLDKGLKNGVDYCYKIKSIGIYRIDTIEHNTENNSHKNCAIPIDKTAPCAPQLSVTANCDSLTNTINWNNPNLTCCDDVVSYNLFFTQTIEGNLNKIKEIIGPENTSFKHFNQEGIGGCYAITAVDSFDNESPLSALACSDECTYYELPNVFTPNNDGINDIYYAKNTANLVKKVDMKIYNRLGELVYTTANPLIKWNGKYKDTNDQVPTAVYYYICDVYEQRISGLEVRNMVGFIHVYTENTNKIIPLE
ncbi:MAG: gliding motility-associated C-terminal domain-containing protein [Bacteroidales bacterium]|jgi:gliding motility-associated-like protein|nr:gliding motility-associated C-terminal domain-containing protein [Bacteroidales bacterium]